MKNSIKYPLLGIILLIIQLLINEFINVYPLLYIAVSPLFLIVIDNKMDTMLLMLIAFAFGFLTDLFTGGVLGLSAGALTAAAFFRNSIMYLSVPQTTLESSGSLSCKNIGTEKFIIISLVCYAIFFAVYIALDSIGSYFCLYSIIRFLVDVIINTGIAVLIDTAILKNF